MPIITVEGPKVQDIERKRQMVRKMTDAAVEAYGIKEIVVLIHENEPHNVRLRRTRPPRRASRLGRQAVWRASTASSSPTAAATSCPRLRLSRSARTAAL